MANTSNTKSALIIGASRGLGLGLVTEYAGRGWHVTATVRRLPAPDAFAQFGQQIKTEMLDINDLAAVEAFLPRVKDQLFDVVFINAGVGGPEGKNAETVTPAEMSDLFMTNAISPVRLGYKLVPLVKPGSGILAFMTSILGSVTLSGGTYAQLYCASKSALNQLTRSFVAELKANITVLSMHPGWVRTDMGGAGADIDVATSVKGLVDVLTSKAGSHVHEYLDYRGKTIPW
ncbi:MAG: short-chain dehydrogenase [Acidocella sp. 20-57-95]|nr:MAG: short-chain dehydrogenase [Acidocella sp. 20-57-95]OYV62001.1 MAG: short-chain dehydrogenase [Acidocella sp. 21-58-7]HQT64321.1 SDR family oxidoreductase [Acidocella sp.]HQU04709.1 SDR family oxidoreductase [Acidocella sp.]